jgi:pimeloyl-ACP methyl ester carboxylesterase
VTEAGSGPPIVLLHGASIAVEGYGTFFRQMEALADSFRVITFDQIGFGRTDMPQDGRYRDRLERSEHAIAVLDARGLRGASLVGHSEGAFLAARIALTRPELASRLVLMTTGGTAPALGGALDEPWMAAARAAYDYRNFPATAEGYVAARPGIDERHARLLHEQYSRALASGQAAMMQAQHATGPTDYRAYVRLQEEHILPRLPELDLPTLLIWAGEDATVPVERGLALLRLIRGADMYVVGGAGHNLMHDQPEVVTGLLRAFCASPVPKQPTD